MSVSPLQAAVLGRCPACGKGRLFKGLLAVADTCSACGLSLAGHEKGDGPAVFVILFVGFIVAALSSWVEVTYQPPYWLHAVLWTPVIVVLSLYFLRFFKALIVAVQHRHMGLR